MQEKHPLWGFDLGGTKIEGVILESRENMNVLYRMRVPTEAQQGYDHIIGQVQKLVEMLSTIGFEAPVHWYRPPRHTRSAHRDDQKCQYHGIKRSTL